MRMRKRCLLLLLALAAALTFTACADAAGQTYTAAFDLNYQNATGAPAAQTVTAGGKLTEPATPARSGYSFGGWYKEAACENAWDFAADFVTGNMTLYAKWTEDVPEAVTVSFDLNYENAAGAPAAQTVTAGGKLTEPATPERSGYLFDGWYKEAVCENAWDFAADLVTENMTLYAKWTEDVPETFTVSFSLNYEGAAALPSDAAYESKLVRMPAVPERTGYQFCGWYREAACENIWWFTKDRAETDMTLYAKWEVALCEVSFDNITPNYDRVHITVPYGQPVPADKVPQPDAGGRPYHFMGWYVNGEPYDLAAPVTEDYLYISGQWKYPVRVIFQTDMGQTEVEAEWGAAIDESLVPEAPPREHASFTGWQDGTGTFYPKGQPIVISEEGYVQLSPQYQMDSCDVVFLSNGAEVARKKVEYYACAGKVTVTPPEGKRFAGWFDAETDGAYFDPEYTPVTGPLTLYARFEDLTYQIILPNVEGYFVMLAEGENVTHGNSYRFTVSGLQPGDAVLVNGAAVTGTPDAANASLTAFSVENAVETQVISISCAASQPQTLIFYDSASNVLAQYCGNPGTWVPIPNAPEMEGKDFAGWYDAPEGGNPLKDITIGTQPIAAYAQYRPRTFNVQFWGMADGVIEVAYGTRLNQEEVDALSWMELESRYQYVFRVGEDVLTYEELLALPIFNSMEVHVSSEFVKRTGTLTLVYEKDDGIQQKTLEVSNEIPLWYYLEREDNALTLYRWYADEARTVPVNIRETYLAADTLTLFGKPAEKVITVTFDAAGGTCPVQSVVYERDSFDNDAPLPACVRKGYVFIGWYTQEGQAVESWQYVYGNCLEDVTLVAQYLTAVDYPNEAIVGDFAYNEDLFSFRADGSYIAWRNGRLYTGHYRAMDEAWEKAWRIDGIGIVRLFEEGLHLEGYGVLAAVEGRFVVFDLKGLQTVLRVPKGGTIQSYPQNVNGWPVVWYRDRYYSVAWDQDELVGESVALYGRVEVCVTYEANGGDFTGDTTATYFENDFWGDNKALINPSKEGFFFDGWYADAAFTGRRIDSFYALCVLGPARVTLYAKWLAPVDYADEVIVGSFAGPMDNLFGGSAASGYATLTFLADGTMTVTRAGKPVLTNYRKTGENAFTVTYPAHMAISYDASKDCVTVAYGETGAEKSVTLSRIDTADDAELAQAFAGTYTGCIENALNGAPNWEESEYYYGVVRLEFAADGTGMLYLNGEEASDLRWYIAGGTLVVTVGELEACAAEEDGVFTMTVFRQESEAKMEVYFAFSRAEVTVP